MASARARVRQLGRITSCRRPSRCLSLRLGVAPGALAAGVDAVLASLLVSDLASDLDADADASADLLSPALSARGLFDRLAAGVLEVGRVPAAALQLEAGRRHELGKRILAA